jgi:hypothetical protein
MYCRKDDIIYPIFIECLKYTDDIFWKNIFEELSYGKCPYGIYISNNYICCNYKDKKFSYKIDESKYSVDIYNELVAILKYKFGLLSKYDKLQKNKLFLQKQDELIDTLNNNWSNIKKKNIKLILLEKFIINKSNSYNLNMSQSKELYNKILLGLLLKTITKNQIIYEHKKIKEITCITFKPHEFTFNENIYNFKDNLVFV